MRWRIYILSMLMLLAAMPVAAQRYSSRSSLTHWLGVSMTGFEATPILGKNTNVFSRPGGGGQAALLYEMHSGHLFFNIGLGADYTLVRCGVNTRSDAFDRVDFMGEQVLYRYVYSAWKEKQTQLRVILPVQIGYRFGDWFYMALGATYRSAPVKSHFDANTRMLTEGEYNRFIQPIRNADAYGYWGEADYSGGGEVLSATHEMAVELELGVRIPLTHGVQMRAGVFAGYDIPLVSYKNKRSATLAADYSTVDTNPFSQSQANLSQQLRFYSLFDSPEIKRDAQRVRAGMRITFIFNVTHTPSRCMCMTE